MTAAPSQLFPLRYARGNLLFGRGDERVGLYRLPMISYPYKSVADKWSELGRLERLAITVGADFSLWRVQRAYPAERYEAQVEELLDDRHQSPEQWRNYIAGHYERLTTLASHIPELYLAVALREPTPAKIGGGLIRASDRARRRLEDLAGVSAPQPISHRDLLALANLEQRTFEWIRRMYGAERATTSQLQWLLRRAACRGVGEPRLDPHWTPDSLVISRDDGPVYEPLENDLWRLLNAPIQEDPRDERGDDPHGARLVIDAEEGRSYQTFMTLGALADDPYFPGGRAELLYDSLEAITFPVDAVLHAQWIGNRDALSQVRKRILEVDNAFADAAEGSRQGAGWLADEDRSRAREYEAILQSGEHPPMLRASVTYAIGADSARQLEQRASSLQETLGDIVLHRPNMMQETLFYDALPRAGGGRIPDYIQQMTTEQFAAMMPAGTSRVGSSDELGNSRGIYIGWSPAGGGRPVKTDPTEASQRARTSAIAFVGGLGSGKALAVDTPIPTPDGWRDMGELEVGQRVFDEEGRPCRITMTTEVMHEHRCYEVLFSDGSSVVADAEHRWLTLDLLARRARGYRANTTKRSRELPRGTSRHRGVYLTRRGRWHAQVAAGGTVSYVGTFDDEDEAARAVDAVRCARGIVDLDRCAPAVRTTDEIAASLYRGAQLNHAIPLASALQYDEVRDLPLDPFVLGLWLADGASRHGMLTIGAEDQEETIANLAAVGQPVTLPNPNAPIAFRATGLTAKLNKLGLLKNKHIPATYLRASVEQRLSLLQGLMDGDGYISAGGSAEYCSTRCALASDVYELVLGLGIKATMREDRARLHGRDIGPRYRICFSPELPVFRLSRKLARVRPSGSRSHRRFRYIVAVRPVASVPVRCITVDSPSHLYLAGHACIPTHNTVSAQLYAFAAERRGSQIVSIDSKQPVDGRYEHGFDRVPELEGRVDIIELSGNERERGKLDPLVIGLDDYREQLAASYFITLLGEPPSAQQNAIKRAILEVVRRGERSSRAVVDELLRSEDPHAREAGDSLDVLSNFGLAGLGLGKRENPIADERAAAAVTTIRMPGLVLPDPRATRSEYEDNERVSVATLHLAAAYALRLVAHDRERHKVILFDETKFLLGSPQGRAIVTKMVLAGRAVNATIALAVQRLDYLGDLEELIGTMFVFGQESDADARRALEILGLDPADRSLVQLLRGWSQSQDIHGRCLMRDLDGRVDEVQFDPVYEHLLQAFNTTPPRARKRQTQAEVPT